MVGGVVLVGWLLGCGDDDASAEDPVPEWECSDDVPGYDEVTAFPQVCENCHSSTLEAGSRRGAPEGLNFDDYEIASDNAERIATEVYWGNMPPSGSDDTLTVEQQDTLFEWALCGAPE